MFKSQRLAAAPLLALTVAALAFAGWAAASPRSDRRVAWALLASADALGAEEEERFDHRGALGVLVGGGIDLKREEKATAWATKEFAGCRSRM